MHCSTVQSRSLEDLVLISNKLACLFALGASLMMAQTTGTGTLVGTVVDTSGAVVVGAKVTIVNPANAFVSEVVTNGEGG